MRNISLKLDVFTWITLLLNFGCGSESSIIFGQVTTNNSTTKTSSTTTSSTSSPVYQTQPGATATVTYLPVSSLPVQNYINGVGTVNVASFAPGAPDVVVEPNSVKLGQLNYPTINYLFGMTDSSGNPINDLNGNLLTEYFSLRITTNLWIPASATQTNYQIAILADDGAIVNIGTPGGKLATNLLINNDGPHSNTLGCSSLSQPVVLTPGVPTPLSVNYYQGRPVSLGLILLWRPATTTTVSEPQCGVGDGDTYYFNTSLNPPTPAQTYLDLYTRGWVEIPASNLVLVTNVSK